MKKRLGALLLVLAMALGLCAGASAAEAAPDWDKGSFGDGAFSWRVTPSGTLHVSPSGAAPVEDYQVYAACYDSADRFLGAKVFSSGQTSAQLDPRTVGMKFMWTDSAQTPQCEAVSVWRTQSGELSQEYVFLAGNTWTAAQNAYMVPIVDARGVSTTLPVTEALKDAIAADSMEPGQFAGNAYVGLLCSITELDANNVVSKLRPVAIRDVLSLSNGVIVLKDGYAWDYDDATKCVYVDLGRDSAGRITVERSGVFDPERFFDPADVDASAAGRPFRTIQAAVAVSAPSNTADLIYVVRTLRQSPLQPGIRLQTSQLTLGVGSDSLPLQSVIYPAGGVGQELVWSSSDPAVATVHGGVVHGVAEGTAVITLSAADGTLSDACTCTVTEVPPVCMVTGTEVYDSHETTPGGLRANLLFMDGSTQALTVSKLNGRTVVDAAVTGEDIGQKISVSDAQREIGASGSVSLTKFFSARLTPEGCELTELNSAGGTSPDWEDPVSVGNGADVVASICKESAFAKGPGAAVGWSQPLRGWPIVSDNLTRFIVKKVNSDGDTIYTVYRGFREVPEMEAGRLTAICQNSSGDPASVNTVATYVYIEAAS